MVNIPSELKQEYPFSSHFSSMKNHKLHYIDEGSGDAILMVHGNPTWSFFYRNLAKHFSKNFRVVVPDHLGCGLSDKPQDYEYTLKNHIDNLEKLVLELGLTNITLVLHDWGGAIGMGLATRNPQLIKKNCCYEYGRIHFRRNSGKNKYSKKSNRRMVYSIF
jgi:haloalkane dehalogenase